MEYYLGSITVEELYSLLSDRFLVKECLRYLFSNINRKNYSSNLSVIISSVKKCCKKLIDENFSSYTITNILGDYFNDETEIVENIPNQLMIIGVNFNKDRQISLIANVYPYDYDNCLSNYDLKITEL